MLADHGDIQSSQGYDQKLAKIEEEETDSPIPSSLGVGNNSSQTATPVFSGSQAAAGGTSGEGDIHHLPLGKLGDPSMDLLVSVIAI